MGPESATPSRRPAEGAWSDQAQPGTGLYLQTRGPLLSVAQFDYLDDRAQWRLDVTPMRGDQALLLLRDFENGSCFGCDPYAPASTRVGGTPLRITFASARRARAELSDGTVVPIVSLPFGADYVPVTLADLPDAEFGPLPLPDLSGTWAVRGQVVTFGAPVIDGPSVRFPPVDGDDLEIRCTAFATGNTSCSIVDTNSMVLPPAPPFGFAPLGDVEENRIRMQSSPEPGAPFYMVRIPSAD